MSTPTQASKPTRTACPTVTVISYSLQLGPLDPPPHLTYDLRSMPSPPKDLRLSCDGRDKRLRGFMMEFPKFVALLNAAFEDSMQLAGTKPTPGPNGAVVPPSPAEETLSRPIFQHVDGDSVAYESESDSSDASGGESPEESKTDSHDRIDDGAEHENEIRVGVYCVRGRHRSAAFAEQLARMEWPRGTEIRLHHRDVDKRRRRKNTLTPGSRQDASSAPS